MFNYIKALKEREALFKDNENSSETAEASYRIRCSIKSIRESANNLKDIANKQEKKVKRIQFLYFFILFFFFNLFIFLILFIYIYILFFFICFI